jgi:chemotaxis protein methyltransferase CheR
MIEQRSYFNDLGDKEFIQLREIIFRESGINLTERKKALMQSRLIKRLKFLKLDSYRNYCEYLKKNYEDEIVSLINCITTNKTDFFREAKHFSFLKDTVLPDFEKRHGNKLRIWSAGCSTGEEPYSIAITLAEYYKNKLMPDIKILATDIDTDVLEKARSGVYKRDCVEELDFDLVKRYFLKGRGENEGLFVVKDFIKKMIYFRRLNLLDKVYPMKKLFDLIFCRNVIIYFDRKTRDEVINRFYDYLHDDGYFFAGHSETLSSFNSKYYLIGNTIYGKVMQCS